MEGKLNRPLEVGDDLLARYRDGDGEALARIRDFARWVVYERGYFVPYPERDDLLQEVLLDVYRAASAPGFRLRHGVEAFVRSVAHRRCIDWVRRRRWSAEALPPTDRTTPGPEGDALARERLELARRVLAKLSPACRELIVKRTEGLSYAEIAHDEGSSEQAMRNRLYKCLQKARRLFRQLDSPSRDGES